METNNQVCLSLPKNPLPTTPLSFAAATTSTQTRNKPNLPRRPSPTIFQNQLQEVPHCYPSKIWSTKTLQKKSPQEACNRINKALMDSNANVDNTSI
ncbi:hypothetical protein O181_051951 [Austropuccinia psidii MF-1]|uniref:Uncharacterized protein n=1 Tax=Austropuccinia psidii MF-1 TaxID=1389203 RepID=A0A9Q3DXE9_9BASI|nr:hypothetical protein [Austropuccinia psidii MF-1]